MTCRYDFAISLPPTSPPTRVNDFEKVVHVVHVAALSPSPTYSSDTPLDRVNSNQSKESTKKSWFKWNNKATGQAQTELNPPSNQGATQHDPYPVPAILEPSLASTSAEIYVAAPLFPPGDLPVLLVEKNIYLDNLGIMKIVSYSNMVRAKGLLIH